MFTIFYKKKILDLPTGTPIGQDYLLFVNPDGTHKKSLVGSFPSPEPTDAYTKDQIRGFIGQTESVYYVKGNGQVTVALYRKDSLATDNGTTVIVTADGRRYFLMTQTQFNNMVAKAWDLWDTI